MFPAESHGAPFVAIAGMYAGDVEEGERVLKPLRELGEPIADFSGPMPYTEAQKVLDEDYPDGRLYYWKSLELDGLAESVFDRLLAHAERAPSDHSTVDVWYHGGAMNRFSADETAFGDRALILLGYEANWDEPEASDENVAWVRDSLAELEPFSRGSAYLNFPGFFEEGDELLRASYGDANYERLAALKNTWDPSNLFRLNGNIKPSV
jgi:hypothetical protein